MKLNSANSVMVSGLVSNCRESIEHRRYTRSFELLVGGLYVKCVGNEDLDSIKNEDFIILSGQLVELYFDELSKLPFLGIEVLKLF